MVLLYHCILPPRATSVVNQWWGEEHMMVGWQEEARLEERGGGRGGWGEAGSLVAGICPSSWALLSFSRGLENYGLWSSAFITILSESEALMIFVKVLTTFIGLLAS